MELFFPMILDGATGTQLQKRGFASEMATEEWVLLHPQALQEVQYNYIENGSDIVYCSTFGGNRIKLEENGIKGQTEEYNKRLFAVSKEVTRQAKDKLGKTAYVAGDLAPTGKFLTPMGDKTFEDFVDIYKEQAKALEEAGADLFVVETQMTVPEARAAVLAVKSVSDKPVFVTFTCDKNGRTLTGTDIVAALVIFQGMGVDAFGMNCSVGPDDMLVQLRRLQEYAEVPLIAKPNAGMPEMVDGKTVYNCPPEEFSKYVDEFLAAGVGVFGGCCGTEEGHIKALYEGTKGKSIVKPQPQFGDKLTLATEKKVSLIPQNLTINPEDVLDCDEDLIDALDEEDEKDSPVTAIAIRSEEELEDFEEYQCMIEKPLCLLCDDAKLLEKALRMYQGRALYEGQLTEAELKPLADKYGLIW